MTRILEQNYVYLIPEGDKQFVDGLVAGRIYKVIETGPDWYLLRANGRSQYIYYRDCRSASYEEFIHQDDPVDHSEEDRFLNIFEDDIV